MPSWWNKMIAGDAAPAGGPASASPPTDPGPAAGRRPPRDVATWDQAFARLQQRVNHILEDLEARPPHGVGSSPNLPDHLALASARLEEGRAAQRAELDLLVRRLRTAAAPASPATDPPARSADAEQREALGRIDQRLELIKVRTTATSDAMTSAVAEIQDLRRLVDDCRQALARCQQTEAELAANQRQMAESLNVLHDLVTRTTEIARSNAAWVEVLAEAPESRYQAIRDHVTRQSSRFEFRSTVGLVLSALAAVAALAALILSLAG
jgi:small-conductance mechanosensitive channel